MSLPLIVSAAHLIVGSIDVPEAASAKVSLGQSNLQGKLSTGTVRAITHH